jgi:hypothetical protein
MVISTYLTNNQTSPELCSTGGLAFASPWMYEKGTNRPVAGIIIICVILNQLDIDLTILAHETFHAIVRSWFFSCPRYPTTKHVLSNDHKGCMPCDGEPFSVL